VVVGWMKWSRKALGPTVGYPDAEHRLFALITTGVEHTGDVTPAITRSTAKISAG
jgi:hypothetical protein